MTRFVFSLGSNVSSAEAEICHAIEYLREILTDAKASTVYSSLSIKGDGVIYHNAVISGYSDADIETMNRISKDYEALRGRQRGHGAPVVIDIDVVIAGDNILRPADYSRDYFTRGYNELS